MKLFEMYKHKKMRDIAFVPISNNGSIWKGYWYNVHYYELGFWDRPMLATEGIDTLDLAPNQLVEFIRYNQVKKN